jgi:hypothetical protein
MKRRYPLLAALALALGVAFAGPASAHGGGNVHFGFYMGVPVGVPYYYPPAYYPYYYPPAVVQPSSPPVYIERQDAAPESAPSTLYWYYCPDAKAYYPYVNQCPGGWQRVEPQPPQ